MGWGQSLMKKLAAGLCALAVSACAAGGGGLGGCGSLAGLSTGEQLAGPYRLGVGDELSVVVFGETNLSGDYIVNGQGVVSFPLVGEVEARGRTLREFSDSLVAVLSRDFLNNPSVSIDVLNYRPYFILGEVNAPGEYPYREGLSVVNAVAIAEGFTYRANQCRVFVQRSGVAEEIEFALTAKTPVQPGDTIRFVERIL